MVKMESPEIEKDNGIRGEEIQSNYVPGKPYSKLRRELSEEDLSNGAVQKLLLNEIDKLEMRICELEIIEKKFYEVDKLKAVQDEKLITHNSIEILYSSCLAIGSAILGLSSMLGEKAWVFLIVGGVLIIGGLVSKYKKWN